MHARPLLRLIALAAIGASTAALTGCVADEGPFEADVPNPCDLLTTAQIEEALGSAYEDAKPNEMQSTERQSVCEWWSTDAAGTFVQVLIKVDASSVAAERESAKEGLGATIDLEVAGATDAYSMLSGAMIGMAAGDYFVQVSNLSGDGGDQTAETLGLAEIVVAGIEE